MTETTTPEERYTQARDRREADREALKRRLEEEGAEDLVRRLAKCGEVLRMVCTGCGDTRECRTRCDIKWCPSCSHALATRTVQKYQTLVGEAVWPLFVTWTTKNYDEPTVRPLRKAWGKLRRLRWFRKAVKGGVTAFECTNKGNGWHWHAHSLVDCRWLAVSVLEPRHGSSTAEWKKKGKAAAQEVSQQWSLCTGRASSIHVRRVWKNDDGDVTKACMEVLKYSVTASSLLDYEEPISPMLRLLDGTRLVTSFGTFFGKAKKQPRPAPKICACGSSDCIPEFMVPRTMKKPGRSVTFRP